MATLVKRNKREKKKSKPDKSSIKTVIEDDLVLEVEDSYEVACTSKITEQQRVVCSGEHKDDETTQDFEIEQIAPVDISNYDIVEPKSQDSVVEAIDIVSETLQSETQITKTDTTVNYNELSAKLDLMSLLTEQKEISESRALELENPNAYLLAPTESKITEQSIENVVPSAPLIEEIAPNAPILEIEEEIKPKIQCMPLEEAVKLYGGTEIAVVKAMSEREEAIVEAGPVSGPEHPLVDLLSTFRTSLMSLDRVRVKLASEFSDENRTRDALWKTEKRVKVLKQSCKCGAVVDLKIMYDHSELNKGRLPAAKMKLQKLMRDVQESYCHHQHAALLTHYQIEITLSDILQSSKADIREALSLVLQALKMSDGAPDALPIALVRWAGVLAAALVDGRDLGHLLFLMHHLFRQNRSVRWASRVVHVPLADGVDAARALALLDILLNHCKLETAAECNEEDSANEDWEEVSMRGAGAVSEGTLRERDLLSLFNALPMREIVAKILLFNDTDIKSARSEWWGDTSGGKSTLTASCGVRALLSCLNARPHYARLRTRLRTVATAAMKGLACLYRANRKPYEDKIKEQIISEMEACFAAGYALFDKENLTRVPTSLLSDDTARDYCLTFIAGLHEKISKTIESLNIEIPVLECATRVRIVAHAAADRTGDHDLAGIVLDFLYQIGIKKKIVTCKGGCEIAARESMELLLKAHPYLHPVALRIMADVNQVEQLDPQLLNALHVDKWRPSCDEMQALLQDWTQRCPALLPHLLLNLDYTPFNGIPLDIQVQIGEFLTRHPLAKQSEWRWSVLRRLRTHRVCWRLPLDAPAPEDEPTDIFDKAFALLATSWGHSIPMICSVGVNALAEVSRARAADGTHCAALLMLVMASSPESVSLTPKFGEVFASLASQSPSLLSRAFGRGGISGTELLQRLVLTQLEGPPVSGVPVFPAWLHALWLPGLRAAEGGAGALTALEAAAITARDWSTLHAHAHALLQDGAASTLVTSSTRHAHIAPLLCEVLLRSYHTQRELNTQLFPLLLAELNAQRIANKKIHVDNALQKIGASMSSDELCIYRCASAALAAPVATPAHLMLWALFFHLYLQRPHPRSDLAVGPLFFSGLIKTRMLSQMKRKLQETVSFHHQESIAAKMNADTFMRESKSNSREISVTKIEGGLFPPLNVKDLTGESDSTETDSDDSNDENDDKKPETSTAKDSIAVRTKQFTNMATYHSAAERLVTEYVGWLEAYDKVKALPHHANLARVIPDYALEEAWKVTLSNMRPPPSSELDDFPRVADPPANDTNEEKTPFSVAVNAILTIKETVKLRTKLKLKLHLEEIKLDSKAAVVNVVDKHYKDMEKFAKEWCHESDRIVALDLKLWDFVSQLKMSRPIAPIRKNCIEKCREPVLFIIEEFEYLTNSSADEAIKENRELSRQAIRRLSRAKPHVARAVAQLLAIVKRIRSYEVASQVLEMTWRVAGACDVCPTVQEALTGVFTDIAQQWISNKGQVCAELIRRWCRAVTSPLQQTLIGSLVAPRSVSDQSWAPLYFSVITANLPPHIVFSCLSKFEMSKWMQTASEQERRELLKAIVDAAQRNGPSPHETYGVVLELVGVHAGVVATPQVLPELILVATKAAIAGTLPLAFWPHVIGTANCLADNVHFDQLGHLLRSMGSLWKLNSVQPVHVLHAPHVASVLHVLMRAFVRAAVALSYEPARVGWYAWGALLEAWSPWLVTAGPLAFMLPLFIEAILQIMTECPGSEIRLLQLVFEWAVATHATPALLTELSRLPWDYHQWFSIFCLQFGLQMFAMGENEFTSWAKSTWRATKAETLVQLVAPEQLAQHLANLLHLFTSTAHHPSQFLEEGTRLPWWLLHDHPFGEALDRFFLQQLQPAVAYHELPQFKIFLYASEIKPLSEVGQYSHAKRSRLISQWTCSAAAPAHLPHLTSHVNCVLKLFTELAPHVKTIEEMEEYISRALIIMCTEPSGVHALQLWCDWISRGPGQCVRATAVASVSLTVPKYAAKLTDVAVKTLLLNYDGWDWIISRWQRSAWRSPMTFACRGAPHAAYAATVAHAPVSSAARDALASILACCKINFVEDEVIAAVWICYASRVMRACLSADPTVEVTVTEPEPPPPAVDCAAPECPPPAAPRPARDALYAARRLLRSWAAPQRRSFLKIITLKMDTDVPTPQHRLLCLLGQCTIDPCPANVSEYEAMCTSVLGSVANEVMPWVRSANLAKLLALATKLYPNHVRYFQFEIDNARELEETTVPILMEVAWYEDTLISWE